MGTARPSFDVAIVGGGPAGSSTALHLSRAMGIEPSRIIVLDRASHPRDKPCGGALSAWGVEALSRVGVSIKVPHVVMRGVRILLGDEVGETLAPGMGVIIRRTELDKSLLDDARKDGVTVREGEGLVALARDGRRWTLTTTKGTLDASLVCACDGAGSTVRKLLGFREPARKGHLYVTDTPPERGDEGTESDLCDFDMTPTADGIDGYYWDFPTVVSGERMVNRGIYHANIERPTGRGPDVKAVLRRYLARRGIDMDRVKLRPFSTRPLVAGSRFSDPGVIFVGEAAGIDRATGEGIAQAILYGEIAARHVASALRTGARDFVGYDRDVHTSPLGRHLRQSAWLAGRVFSRRGAPFRKLLVRSPLAREAGVRWYRGEKLGLPLHLRLGAVLVREALF